MNKFYPSDYLPHFFRQDLGTGSAQPHPMSLALDAVGREVLQQSSEQVLSLWPTCLLASYRDKIMEFHGLRMDHLSESEREQLYLRLDTMFSQGRTAWSIELLATLYFEGCKVLPGRDHTITTPATLTDFFDHTVLTIRLAKPCSAERIQEFLDNARLFTKRGTTVEIARHFKTPTTKQTLIPVAAELIERRL